MTNMDGTTNSSNGPATIIDLSNVVELGKVRPSFHFQSESFREAEFGVVGVEQLDETHYDDRFHQCADDDVDTDDGDDDDDDDDDDCDGIADATGRIRFSKDRLYGRDAELKLFHTYFQALISESEKYASQIVFLSGYSGSGKTRLVKEAVRQFSIKTDIVPIYVHGKYDELLIADPYKGIAEALDRWYMTLSKDNKDVLRYIREEMEAEVGEDASILTEVIPRLRRMLLDEDGMSIVCGDSSVGSRRTRSNMGERINKNRLHHVFHVFLKCLCTQESPLVMFLDDLQWADEDSLDLLTSILSEGSIQHVFFIGAFRSNEVSTDHPLSQMIDKLRNKRRDIVDIVELSDLAQGDVQEFIGDTLNRETEEVDPLTKAIYSRTLGNMFFTMQALEQLVRKNALYYDMISFQWCWVLPQDQLEALLSNEVLEMVKSKIQNLSGKHRNVLTVASYTRSTFDVDTLFDLLIDQESNKNKMTRKALLRYLDRLVLEGLLFATARSGQYSFAHDRIREASTTFVTGKEKEDLLFHIGNALATRSQSLTQGEEWMLSTALYHLNSLSDHYHPTEESRLKLARLNAEAAKLSMSKAAFSNAAHEAEQGISYLPEDGSCWDRYPELSRDLYSVAGDAYRLIGNVERMEYYCRAFLKAQENESPDVKSQVCFTLATGLTYGTDRVTEAKVIILEMLEHLGCRFPKSGSATGMWKLTKGILQIAMTKKKRTKAEVDELEPATDPKKVDVLRLLDRLFDICYIDSDHMTMILVIFQGIKYTFKYGLTIYSPRLFASATVVFSAALNDLQGAKVYGDYALDMMAKVNHRPSETGTILFAYSFGLLHTMPIADCIPPLQRGFSSGMTAGEAEDALMCAYQVQLFKFMTGKPLEEVEAGFSKYAPMIAKLGQRLIYLMGYAMWDMILGIMGKSKAPAKTELTETEQNTPMLRDFLHGGYLAEQGYLGKYKLAADLSVEVGSSIRQTIQGSSCLLLFMFPSAVSCAVMARRTKKSKYKKETNQIKKWLVSWEKQGNPNVRHMIALLDAEDAAMRKKNFRAIEKYELAVQLALEVGCIHDAAIANECWGDFALECLGDEAQAIARLKEALLLCKEWGSKEKTASLTTKFDSLQLPSEEGDREKDDDFEVFEIETR